MYLFIVLFEPKGEKEIAKASLSLCPQFSQEETISEGLGAW